ncbi:MAG TPA: NAD(P)H-hydrate epimerase, partial [Orrella sp.]
MKLTATQRKALHTSAIRALEAQGFAQGLPMMHRAGQSAARFAHEHISEQAQVLCLVGPGNNGGDALVAATELQALGHHVTAVMPAANPNASADAKQALAQWLAAGGKLIRTLPTEKPDLVIDGLFGIGLDRPLTEPWQTIVQTVNDWQTSVLALDIPSGVDADSGQALDTPIRATWTLAFLAPSLATTLPEAQV